MLDDKLLEPLNSGHLMINPRVKDSAKELCEQLIDIYMAENDETESKITAQIKTKIILLQFILEMFLKIPRYIFFRKMKLFPKFL